MSKNYYQKIIMTNMHMLNCKSHTLIT